MDKKLLASLKNLEDKLNQIVAVMVTKDDAKNFATKDDLQNFATKDDLQNFATKDDLQNFATKDDLQNFATKDDLQNFATKDDLQNLKTELINEIRDTEISIIQSADAYKAEKEDVTGLEKRVTRLERKVFT